MRSKYDEMSSCYQEERSKNYEVQNLLNKYEMESKFYRESGDMQRTEHQTTLNELKKLLAEKAQAMEELEIENRQNATSLKIFQQER